MAWFYNYKGKKLLIFYERLHFVLYNMHMHALIIRAQKAQEHLFRMDIGSVMISFFRVHLHLHPHGPTHSLYFLA